MVLLGLFLLVVAGVAGASTAVVLWPLFVVGSAVLYCVDRPRRRNVRIAVAALGVVAAVGYRFGPWHVTGTARYVWFLVPIVVGLLIVLGAGGPGRIKARHERAEAERRRQRVELIAATRAARAERGAQRRQARRDTIQRKTGLDVGLVADVTATRTRVAGAWITRRLQRNRPARASGQRPTGPPDLLDLDQDVAADLSHRRSEEILRLAGELDETRRPRPRPSP